MARSQSWFVLTACVVGVLLARESRRPDSPVAGVDRVFFDWLGANVAAGRPAPGTPTVTLVAIDDDVADAPGRLPLTPLEYASFLHSVARFEPAVVALEPVLDFRGAPPGAEQLLLDEAINVPKLLLAVRLGSDAGRAVDPAALPALGDVRGSPARLAQYPEVVAAPDAPLLALAAAAGVTTLPGIAGEPVRDLPLLLRCRERVVPSFALQLVTLALRRAPSEVSAMLGSHVQLGEGVRLPLDPAGRTLLDPRAFGRINRLSLDDLPLLVVDQATPQMRVAAERMRGGVVVLGRTDHAARTLRLPDGRSLSPAEAFAWAAASLEELPPTRRASAWWDAGIVAAFAALGRWLSGRHGRGWATLLVGVALAAYALGALALFGTDRLWLPVALPVGLTLLIGVLIWLLPPPSVSTG